MPLQVLRDNLNAVLSAGYSVSCFTDFKGQIPTDNGQTSGNTFAYSIWVKRRVDEMGSGDGELVF